jgi:hypothetical protein
MQRLVGLLTVVVLVTCVLTAQTAPGVARAAPPLPGVGTPVTFPLREGGEVTMTVTQVVDPFGALGGGTPPAGMRFVYVGLAVVNRGKGPLAIDPSAFFVVDAAGFVYCPSDPLGGTGATQSVAPGASVNGGVVFAVPADAVLTAVYHDPAADRLILLALLGETRPGGGATETPVPTGTPVAASVDCAAFATYLQETKGRIDRLQAIGAQATDLVGLAQTDPVEAATAVQGWANDATGLAKEQAGVRVPAGLGDLNDRVVQALQTYADAFTQLATGLSNFDSSALQAFQTTLTDGDARMTKVIADLNAVAAGCGIAGIAG